jgi:RecB family endonuclease NucS
MTIYELTQDSIVPIEGASFASQGIKERNDLQRILKTRIHAISSNTMVLAEEFHEWADSRRSIDLLCLDKEANLVVVELKRTEDGGMWSYKRSDMLPWSAR